MQYLLVRSGKNARRNKLHNVAFFTLWHTWIPFLEFLENSEETRQANSTWRLSSIGKSYVGFMLTTKKMHIKGQ
jgi:hypothetical protein